MRFLRALLHFLPMPPVGIALCTIGPLAARTALQAWLPIASSDDPWTPAWQSMPAPPPWAPSANLEWREELDGSDPLGFVSFDDPTHIDALTRTWGVQVEGHLQTNAYFATHSPSPPLDDLIALIVFDQPHWLGPFHEHRMRSFHVADGQAVEVPELTATLGNDHPCGTANALGAHLTDSVPDARAPRSRPTGTPPRVAHSHRRPGRTPHRPVAPPAPAPLGHRLPRRPPGPPRPGHPRLAVVATPPHTG